MLPVQPTGPGRVSPQLLPLYNFHAYMHSQGWVGRPGRVLDGGAYGRGQAVVGVSR
jgi:hypothetical protein